MANVLQLADLTRPGHPRRAQAAALVEAPRRHDHRLEPDDRRRRGHRRAQAVDRGRPLEHHRLRDRRLRRPAARPPPPVAAGRAVPALPARHAPGVLRRRRSRSTRAPTSTTRSTTRSRRSTTPTSRRSWRRTRPSPATSSTPSRPSSTRASSARTTAPSSSESRNAAFRPHKRLLDHVARVIRNEPVFTLLDEQLVAYNAIMDSVRGAGQNQQKVAFIVEGGPGTGKSVIAVNLVAELSALGLRTLHVTGSKAFTENLRKIVGTRAERDVQVLPRHRERRRAARRRHPRRGAPDPDDQHEPLHAGEGAHGQGPDRRHPRRQPRVGLLHRRPAGRPPGRGRQHRPDPRGGRQARRSRSASSSSRRSSARTAPTRSSSGSTTRSSSTGRRRSSGRWTTTSTSGSSARSASSTT